MKIDELRKIISQVKKYNIENAFDTPETFDNWINSLSTRQIANFISLTVEPSEIQFPTKLLINPNLLDCSDYNNRVMAMTKLKNGHGWYHLFDRLCSPNFLASKNYYEDIEMISKAPSAQFPLWIINEDAFINSPYHKEDLKLIVEAKDTAKEDGERLDWLVAEALTEVASNSDSINSPYHREDMQLIARSGSACLQMSHSFPEGSLNYLATNKASLRDPYHLENMKILAGNPLSSNYLYNIMTNLAVIHGKYYREEVNALANAKSTLKASAMYCFISNPDSFIYKRTYDYYSLLFELGLNHKDIIAIGRDKSVRCDNNPNYLKYLQLLNEVDDKYVLFVESLLSNEAFSSSKYCEHDLDILLSTGDKDIFIDLYHFMSNEVSLNGPHHAKDAELISQTENEELREWLINKATSKNSVDSQYHDYDMEYISRLNLNTYDAEVLKEMRYYLFSSNGINHPNHVERLEKLARGELIQTEDMISSHLSYIEDNPNRYISKIEEKPKVFSKIRRIFDRKKS